MTPATLLVLGGCFGFALGVAVHRMVVLDVMERRLMDAVGASEAAALEDTRLAEWSEPIHYPHPN